MKLNFISLLIQKLIIDIKNNHENNWDFIRFGREPKEKTTLDLKLRFLNQRNFFHSEQVKYVTNLAFNVLGNELLNLAKSYSHLNENLSKECLVEVIAYRILGHRKTKLSTNNSRLLRLEEEVRKTANKSDFIISNFSDRKSYLHKFDYNQEQIKLYLPELGPLNPFFLKQYHCPIQEKKAISPQNEEVVIDCGGCWGDTPIEFASSVGPNGKVFVFEYVPKNLEILNKNLSLNPILQDRINVVPYPAWKSSGVSFTIEDKGPASKISTEDFIPNNLTTTSLSIDDLVENENINEIHFIKMDIEGAELKALQGAIKTIKKFRPKLAISVYHSLEEYSSILLWIESLKLGYQFYFRHFTIHAEETILFATSS